MVVGAKFLRDDLPYFLELLGEVVSKTKFTRMYSKVCVYGYCRTNRWFRA